MRAALGWRRVVVVPMLLTLVLGLWRLRRGDAVWHDEAVTIGLASRDLPDLWQTLGRIDAVHGLYYMLMHSLFDAFGTDVVVLRLPSVIAMAAAAAGVTMLGLHLAGPRAGLCAGIVFAVLPGVQQYAQEGRSYALVCALVVWATYTLVRAVECDRRGMWVAYSGLLLVACLLHEFAVLALAAHAVVVPRAMRRIFVKAAVCVVVGLTPLVLVSMRQSTQVGWLDATEPGEYANFALVAGVALAAAWIAGTARRTRTSREGRLVVLGLGLFLAPTGLLMLLSLAKPLYLDRYVVYGAAGLALLVGAAFDQLLRLRHGIRAGAVVAAVVTCAALVPTTLDLHTPASRSDDMTALAAALRESTRPGDGVVYLSVKRRAWELADSRPAAGVDLARAQGPATSHSLYGTEVPPDKLRARMLTRYRIVAVGSPSGVAVEDDAMARVKRDTLADYFEACSVRTTDGSVITVYARPGHC
ncbi:MULTISPECIES: glycosyltransferase family 39 protein [Streptomyces]|uniref:glycosyltransferase family 39 protein n=2 Tax=Streptomyces TaxID=1883 RepID=UPI0021D38B53|nr:glycosyltransferase family 39 protein [Streptomyces sp. CB00271]